MLITLTFALTVTGIVLWFVVVFRRLQHERERTDVVKAIRQLAPQFDQLNFAFAQIGVSAAEAAAPFQAFGVAMRESVRQMEAALSPKQRELYDAMLRLDMLPVDAIHEATARCPD